MIPEFSLIEKIKRKIPRNLQGKIPIGDDTAVIQGNFRDILFTTDTIVEGIDFELKKTPAAKVGRKALAVNLSDIAAMGGIPVAGLVTLGIPRQWSTAWIEKFYEGLLPLARKYKVSIAGGDITRSEEFFCSVALMGRFEKRFVTRSGAKTGEVIGVTGKLGGSILGHHLHFEPRVQEGQFLAQHFGVTAMIDISDGLVQDLGHLLKSSKVSAQIDLNKVPISTDAVSLSLREAKRRSNPRLIPAGIASLSPSLSARRAGGPVAVRNDTILEHALTDGEDFELLFTVSVSKVLPLSKAWKKKFPRVPLSWIGRIEKGPAGIAWFREDDKVKASQFKSPGFSHF